MTVHQYKDLLFHLFLHLKSYRNIVTKQARCGIGTITLGKCVNFLIISEEKKNFFVNQI